ISPIKPLTTRKKNYYMRKNLPIDLTALQAHAKRGGCDNVSITGVLRATEDRGKEVLGYIEDGGGAIITSFKKAKLGKKVFKILASGSLDDVPINVVGDIRIIDEEEAVLIAKAALPIPEALDMLNHLEKVGKQKQRGFTLKQPVTEDDTGIPHSRLMYGRGENQYRKANAVEIKEHWEALGAQPTEEKFACQGVIISIEPDQDLCHTVILDTHGTAGALVYRETVGDDKYQAFSQLKQGDVIAIGGPLTNIEYKIGSSTEAVPAVVCDRIMVCFESPQITDLAAACGYAITKI
ncbi:MAG: hypothetical protein VXB01_04130, partial [Opitutae bacterium]